MAGRAVTVTEWVAGRRAVMYRLVVGAGVTAGDASWRSPFGDTGGQNGWCLPPMRDRFAGPFIEAYRADFRRVHPGLGDGAASMNGGLGGPVG